MRCERILETFTATKGEGSLCVVFKVCPVNISVLSPLAYEWACFINCEIESDLKTWSCLSKVFYEEHMQAWQKDRIKFNTSCFDPSSLVLGSGKFDSLSKDLHNKL